MAEEQRISYETLAKGTPVLAASGSRIGTVEHVLQDSGLDLFDGLVVATHEGLRFVDAAKVTTIAVEDVRTSLSDADVAALPKPDGEAIYHVDALQGIGDSLTAHLGRIFGREHWKLDK